MSIHTLVLGDLKSNTYVMADPNTHTALIIDPACEPEKIIAFVDEKALKVMAILVTHGHYDHIGAVDALKDRYGCPVYTSKAEAEVMADHMQNLSTYFNHAKMSATATHFVTHLETVSISDVFTFEAIFVPGHSPDGVCYYFKNRNVIFSGDTLMEGRIGKTDYYAGGSHELVENIKKELMVLPDETVLYPGHGKVSSIGHEKKHNHYYGKSMWL